MNTDKTRAVTVTLYLETDAGMDDLAEASFWQRTVDRAPLSGETVCVVKQVTLDDATHRSIDRGK